MVTPLSGLFPTGGKDGVACLLLTGPGELGFDYLHWAGEVVLWLLPTGLGSLLTS